MLVLDTGCLPAVVLVAGTPLWTPEFCLSLLDNSALTDTAFSDIKHNLCAIMLGVLALSFVVKPIERNMEAFLMVEVLPDPYFFSLQ